jgi:hypothetical protein
MNTLAECVDTVLLAWLLDFFLQIAKFLVSKNSAFANSAHTTGWMAWYRKTAAFAKRTA